MSGFRAKQKMVGLVLLTLGIGLTGATGAALSTDYRTYLALEGQFALTETEESRLVLEAAAVVTPETRVRQWANARGGVFGLGLLLVVGGALICRRAMRVEDTNEDAEADASGAVDFGLLLNEVVDEVRSMRADMLATGEPTVGDLERFRVRLEKIQKEDLERLLAAGPRVQMRHGVTVFAELFSPLAAGERALNRLWSTLVDRHWPESLASVETASRQLAVAQGVLAGAELSS